MGKAQNDVQTVSFLWAPYGYAAQWVEAPEDVPIWDTSRGFPLTVGMDSGSVGEAENQLELLRKLLKVGHMAYKDTAATWEPLPAPAKGYPRLIRATDQLVTGYYRTNEDVINDVEKLAEDIDAWREEKPVKVLRKYVLALNEKYGAPYKPEDNTLERWLQLAVTVKVHDDAFRNYRTNGFDNAFTGSLAERIGELETNQVVDGVAHFELLTLKRLHKAAADALQMKTNKEAEKTTAFRQKIAGELYGTHKLTVELTANGMITQAPLMFWANHKLFEMWLYDGKGKACAHCRQHFTPRRRNQRYCKDAHYLVSPKGRKNQDKRRKKPRQPE